MTGPVAAQAPRLPQQQLDAQAASPATAGPSKQRTPSPTPSNKRRKLEDTAGSVKTHQHSRKNSAPPTEEEKAAKAAESEASWHARVNEYMVKMGVDEVPDVPMPKSTSPLNFTKGLWLAPMVRIGTLPTRLVSLQYGADLVWGPEIVDRAIIGTERVVDERTGLISYLRNDNHVASPSAINNESAERSIFWTHPIEKPYLIYQIGSATPSLAYAAVKHVAQDVAGVDLNCGCPKPFSTHGGMGSNLLSTPDVLCDILIAMRKAAPAHVSVTCKIRLLPTQEETFALVRKILATGAIDAITVHCRTKEMRPREKALSSRLIEVAQLIQEESKGTVPVAVNGDCWDPSESQRIMDLTGVKAAMLARGAEANPSVFRRDGPPMSVQNVVGPQFVRYALALNNPFGNAKYCLNAMALRPHLQAAGPDASKQAQSRPLSKPYEGETPLTKSVANALKQKINSARDIDIMAAAFGVDAEAERKKSIDEVLEPLKQALAARTNTSTST